MIQLSQKQDLEDIIMGFWKKDPDLSYAFSRLRMIYSKANALTTPREERFDFLLMACGDLSRQYRKGKSELYPIAVAQIFAWFMSLAEALFIEWGGDIIAKAMGEKYPIDRCGYCGQLPCACKEEVRGQHVPGTAFLKQMEWSIARWQQHLEKLYGSTNREKNIPQALNRIFEEVAEIGLLLHQAEGVDDPLDQLERKVAREMTDVLAWLFGVATLLEVDVQEAVSTLYDNLCPICRSPVCMCRSFEKRPRAGFLTHRFMPAEEVQHALAK